MEQDRRKGPGEKTVQQAGADVNEELRQLDEAGAVEAGTPAERRAADGARAAGESEAGEQAARAQEVGANAGEQASSESDVAPRKRVMNAMRGRKAALGLAATTLAVLAGKSTTGSGPQQAGGPELAGLADASASAEKKSTEWDLTVTDHERVDFFIEFLMGKNYDKTKTWLERMGKYGPMIQNELRERGMPQDLLYLTMIESGLNPNAYSKADAAGLWQFIEETGERYGLEVSTYVDERRDPVKSTGAALEYLQMMHGRFDSWYLSAAGYNTGENRVGRLMREVTGTEKGSDTGYWDIWDRLPRETRDYVPLMLAMGHIAKDPAKYGFTDLKMQEPLQFEEVTVKGGTPLSQVATAAGVDQDVIEDLNPQLVKKQTPPGRDWSVRIPVGQSERVLAALDGARPGGELLGD